MWFTGRPAAAIRRRRRRHIWHQVTNTQQGAEISLGERVFFPVQIRIRSNVEGVRYKGDGSR